MEISLVRFGSAEVNVIVAGPPEVSAEAKAISFAPASLLAALIASRNVQPFPVPRRSDTSRHQYQQSS